MDRRIARTRNLLQEALLALAREKDLDAISIADITERATVNRSTFYQHYPDKDTLLADALDEQAAKAGAGVLDMEVKSEPQTLALLLRYVEHLADHASLYRKTLGPHGSPLATARLRRRIELIATLAIEAFGRGKVSGLPPEIAAAGITGALMGVLTAWLELDPMPAPEVAADWAWRAVGGPDSLSAVRFLPATGE
ncbi:TetR/AcrR family transcriptional regulator [Phytomonospora sp. NPDC050363]|uniref:TetR/AcrR family transcriptional regulator n=1 Tax=Phytomonospora sp. NPDC050363 TaxID=3155642 RepID=UPI0033C3B2DE